MTVASGRSDTNLRPNRSARGTVLPIVLAGGRGSRLHELTERTCKAAIPFVGDVRIIDFTLANLERSGLDSALVATQFFARPLQRHLAATWTGRLDLHLRHAPTLMGCETGSRGTADAVRVVLDEIDALAPDQLLVLASDHVYAMDYRAMLASHRDRGAALTIAAHLVPRLRAGAFGIVEADRGDRISRFVEKPEHPPPSVGDPSRSLASMGLYVFDWPWLRACLADNPGALDFGLHVLPIAVAEGRSFVHAPAHTDAFYWRDVGTLDALRRAALDFTDAEPPVPLPGPAPGPLRPCRCEGLVDSFVMPGAMVSRGTLLSRCIVAPGTVVPFGREIGLDAGRDRRDFRRTASGTVLVTPEMLAAASRPGDWTFR